VGDLPVPAPSDHEEDPTTGLRQSPDSLLLAILLEQREQRRVIERVATSTWLGYAQEIGRSTLPGAGVRVDVVIVLGAAGAAGILGGGWEWLAKIVGLGVAP
jgi:hypothetical protein